MNIYDKIDAIFSHEDQDRPEWAKEILDELQQIRELLVEHKSEKRAVDKQFYRFVKEFRESMRADVANNTYPTFYYNQRELGVDFKGLLYDKESLKILSTKEAFKIYKYAYHKQQKSTNSA